MWHHYSSCIFWFWPILLEFNCTLSVLINSLAWCSYWRKFLIPYSKFTTYSFNYVKASCELLSCFSFWVIIWSFWPREACRSRHFYLVSLSSWDLSILFYLTDLQNSCASPIECAWGQLYPILMNLHLLVLTNSEHN